MRNPFTRFARFYNHLLNKHKYPTQIATGGVLWFSGDVLCQSLVHYSHDPKDAGGLHIDWHRVGRMTLYGLAVSAPVYAYWYTFLDKWSHRVFGATKAIPAVTTSSIAATLGQDPINPARSRLQRFRLSPAAMRTWKIIGFKLFADCALFDPAYLALFFTTTGSLEGKSPREIWHKLRIDLLPTYIVDVAVWFPIQTINFRYVPVTYQPLVVQSCNIGWNAYLSFVQHDH
jgi:hypothetical protein